MPQTYEIVRKYGSDHRGHAFIQYHWQDAVSIEEAVEAVAHEIKNGLDLNPGDMIAPPPDEYCRPFDDMLVDAVRRLCPWVYHYGQTHIVSTILTITEAVQIAHHTHNAYGPSFGGIGCATLMVPEALGCDRYPFSSLKWTRLIHPIPFVPLYQCETLVVKSLHP